MKKLKLFLSLLMLVAFSVGNVWADTDVSTTSFSSTSGNIGNDANISYSCDANGVQNAPELNGTYLKLYRKNKNSAGYGNYVEITPNNNCTITAISISFSKNNGTAGVGYAYKVDDATNVTVTTASTSFSLSNISATTSIKFWNYSTEQMQVTSIAVSYSSGGSSEPTGCVAPTFDPEAGTYTSTQSVELSTTTDGATIYYTTDGTDPTESSTKQEYTGAISVSSTQTIKAYAEKEGLDNSSVASAEYKIYPIQHAGTSADPYTVADARNAIDANTGTSNVYVTGKVSNVVGSDIPGWITYDISVDGETTSDQFRVYKGKSTSGNNFTSEDDIQEGDVVVVYGTITYYAKESLYEFNASSQLVSLSRVVTVALYNGANGATKIVGDYTSGTNALPTTAADVAGWTFNYEWSQDLVNNVNYSGAHTTGHYFAAGATEYSGTNLYAIYYRNDNTSIYSTQPVPGYSLSLDPASGDMYIESNQTNLGYIPVGTSVTLSAVNGLVTEWTVIDNDGDVTPTSSSNTSFVFAMPASDVVAEATMCAQPAAPTNLATSLHADATRGKTVFTWNVVGGATSYTLTYTKTGANPVVVSGLTNATYTVNPLAVGAYTWSVKSVNDCGESAAVNGTEFTICPDFAEVTPNVSAATNIAQTTATANWTAVADAAKYTVQVYSGESKVKEYENETGTSKAITDLTANTTYVVKVTAYNACGEASLVGSSVAFTTLKNVYTVSFNANGGTGEIEAVNVTDGESTTLPSSGMTRAGYSLSGWKADNEGDLLEKGASYQVNAVVTLYAQWSPNTINVTYKPNGPTADEVAESFTYGEEYNAKAANTFSREGYQFKHWNNAADGSGAVTLAAGAAYTGTEDIDLYAIWDQLYTVNWIVNGTTKSTQTAIVGAALTEPYAPQVADCDNSKAFVGWTKTQNYASATDAPGDLSSYASSMTMPVNGANYYAVFANEEGGSQDAHVNTTFSSKNWETATEGDATWTSGKAGNQLTSGRGVQVTTGVSGANATTNASYNAVSSVVITYSTNASGSAGAIAIQVGTTDYVTENNVTVSGGTTDRTATFTPSEDAASGAVKMTVTCTTNSVYVKSVRINYVEDATVRSNYTTDCDQTLPTCEAPTFDPAADTYVEVKNVTIATETEDATIYYTTDGSNPATSETKQTYSSPVLVDQTLTLKAVAVKEGYTSSAVTTGEYVINLPQCATPTISLPAGRYTGAQTATLSCETANASIYYTTDGSEPTVAVANLYSGEIAIDADMTVKAVAIAENTTLSEMLSASYQIVVAGSTLWELVSDVNDLKDGDIIVIASNAEGKTMSSAISNSLCSPITSTFSANKSIIETLGEGSGQFTLSKSGDNWKLSNESGYLSSASNKAMSYANEANATAWTISISSNDATINAGGSIGKIMHNVQNTRFTTYTSNTSATMLLPQIYRKSVVCEDPENELAFATSVPAAINNTQTAQLATTGGNGEDVAYTVISANAANATISNDNKFSATAAGTYTVQAKQEMSADYKCAQVVTMDITVTVVVSSVELNKNALTLEVNQFETLEATVLPVDAANKNVTWSVTEGSEYVEVDANGKVTGKAVGNGVVQVETEDGHFTATCAVTVTAPTPALTLTATNPLAFGNVEPNSTKDLTVNLKGSNLVADVTYEITGDNVFTVETELANATISSEDGQTLTIRFAPTAEGDKSATITFTSGVASQSLSVTGTGKKRYTATLHAGNGSVTSETVQEESIGAGITLPAATLSQALQDGGWSFVGWAEAALDNETADAPTTHTGAYEIASDIDLYAIYTRTDVVEKTASKTSGFSSYNNVTIETGKPITFTASSGSAETNHIRVYANATLTVNGGGATIKKVEFVSLSSYKATNFKVNNVNLTGEVWEGSVSSVVFTAGSQVRFSSIAVTYQTSEGLYTTYPAELFTVEYALNGGTGNFSNQMVTKGSSYTIDATEPTKDNHDFLGWNDGTTTYQAAETIENIQDNVTLTAQWQEWFKATTITFKNGETTVDTKENIYRGASYTTPAAPVVDGKLFQGWSDGVNTVAAETEVTVPNDLTENITITYNALWQDILPTPTAPQITAADLANGEWVLVTSASQINAGDVVIVAATSDNYALGTQGSNDYRAREAVVKTEDKSKLITINNAAKLFVQHGSAAEQYSLYDINTTTGENGYIYDPNVSGKNYVRTKTAISQDCSWIIALSENGATIKSANTGKWLKYNSASGTERFSCYNTEGDVALYKWVKKISGTTNIEDVTLTDAVIVPNGATLNVPTDAELENVIVENGGKVTVATGKELTVNDFTIESTAGNSGQLTGDGNVTVNGDIYMEIKFYTSSNGNTLNATEANQWYMISAPFAVNLNGGFQQIDGTPMVFGQDFDLFYYDGQKRADNGSNGWARVSGQMLAGRACLIGFNEGQSTTIRLKAASNEISDPTSITLSAFDGDDANKNWNGVANPRMRYTSVDQDVHIWNNEEGENGRKYTVFSASQYSFVVGTPFFVQATGTIDLTGDLNSQFRAPKREANERIEYCVRITREGATEFADQMYVRASEEATNTYEQGHDLVTWNAASGKSALVWTENYGGKRLAIEEAPIVNNKASYVLGIYAPAAGTYSISVPTVREDATIYLTKNGKVIWNLSMSEYTGSFEKGNNAGYGIRIVKAPQVITGVENTAAGEAGVQKVIIDEHVYILRGEQLYDVNGKMVK